MERKLSNRAAFSRTTGSIDDFYWPTAVDERVEGLTEEICNLAEDDFEERRRREQVQHLEDELEILQEKDVRNLARIESMRRKLSELRNALRDKEHCLERLEEMIPKGRMAQWRWKDDVNTACAFDVPANCLLEKAYQSYQIAERFRLSISAHSLCRVKSGKYTYEIDFRTMLQTNWATGKRRPVATGKRHPVTRTVWRSSSSGDIVERVECALEGRTQAFEAAIIERDQMAHELEKAKKVLHIRTQAEATLKAELQSSRKAAEQMETARDAAEASLKLREDDLAQVTKERYLAKQACNDIESKVAAYVHQLADAQDAASKSRQEAAAAEEKAKLAQQAMVEAKEVAVKTEAQFQDAANSWRTTLEFWKVTSAPLAVRLVDEVSLFKLACKLLPQLSHTQQFFEGVQSRCYHFQHFDIKSVHSIHNPCLWSQYTRAKANLREMHRVFRIKPLPLQPAFTGLQPLLGDCFEPDVELNEVVLVHGCSQAAAETVIKEGFDIRLAGSVGGSLYGTGLYFAQEPCKASQYTGNGLRHLLVVRVTLGDCKYPRERYSGRLPPFRDEPQPAKGRVDALVVNPEASRQRQAHREFVVFDGKLAYPELLITYECP